MKTQTQIEMLQLVKKAVKEIKLHFVENAQADDEQGKRAFVRGYIDSFSQHKCPETPLDIVISLFELGLGFDCRE